MSTSHVLLLLICVSISQLVAASDPCVSSTVHEGVARYASEVYIPANDVRFQVHGIEYDNLSGVCKANLQVQQGHALSTQAVYLLQDDMFSHVR